MMQRPGSDSAHGYVTRSLGQRESDRCGTPPTHVEGTDKNCFTFREGQKMREEDEEGNAFPM